MMSGLALDVTSEESAGELRIQCSGEVLYASCGQLHQELQRWEEQAIRSLVVDCRSVRYLDSTGIAGLNRAARFAATRSTRSTSTDGRSVNDQPWAAAKRAARFRPAMPVESR